jgi:hypothetical protein
MELVHLCEMPCLFTEADPHGQIATAWINSRLKAIVDERDVQAGVQLFHLLYIWQPLCATRVRRLIPCCMLSHYCH